MLISITVLSAWTFRFTKPSIFRGGEANNMIDEFALYGLDESLMIVVGSVKVVLAILILLGALKFSVLLIPSAAAMMLFMAAAVYFHISVGDGLIPTIPSASMLISCLLVILIESKILVKKKS